jgi:hypothetical protein
MQTSQNQLEQLMAFKQRDKFSVQAWNERGLNPSGDEVCRQMASRFDACTDALIAAINKNASARRLKGILKESLLAFPKSEYDTEERGFICDLFFELSAIVNVNFKDNLNGWMHGWILVALMKISRVLRPEKVIDTISQTCSNCNAQLNIEVLKKDAAISFAQWLIVKCANCNSYNLLSQEPGIAALKYGTYQVIETLNKEEYSYEQAQTRMEQIKFFRG